MVPIPEPKQDPFREQLIRIGIRTAAGVLTGVVVGALLHLSIIAAAVGALAGTAVSHITNDVIAVLSKKL